MKHWGEKFSSRKILEKKKDGKLIGFHNANCYLKDKEEKQEIKEIYGP
jgi:hypothetical protein